MYISVHVPDDLATLAPDLERFISAMVHKLHRNRFKGKWENLDLPLALTKLRAEVEELREAIDQGSFADILMEGADIANFALIVSSVALNEPTRRGHPSSSQRAAPSSASGAGVATDIPIPAAAGAGPGKDGPRVGGHGIWSNGGWMPVVRVTTETTPAAGAPQMVMDPATGMPAPTYACERCVELGDRVGVHPGLRCNCEPRVQPHVAPDKPLPVNFGAGAVNSAGRRAQWAKRDPMRRRLADLRRLSYVPRWAIVPTIQRQNVIEHTGHVCMLAHVFYLFAEARGDTEITSLGYEAIMREALTHDAGEALLGDTPSPTKRALRARGVVSVDHLEGNVRSWLTGTRSDRTDRRIKTLVSWLDVLEAAMFLSEEEAMGNRRIEAPVRELTGRALDMAAMVSPPRLPTSGEGGEALAEGTAFEFTVIALDVRGKVGLGDPTSWVTPVENRP